MTLPEAAGPSGREYLSDYVSTTHELFRVAQELCVQFVTPYEGRNKWFALNGAAIEVTPLVDINKRTININAGGQVAVNPTQQPFTASNFDFVLHEQGIGVEFMTDPEQLASGERIYHRLAIGDGQARFRLIRQSNPS